MALEFILSDVIPFRKKISIPFGANCYRCKSGKVYFYHVNPSAQKVKSIPKGSTEICFKNYEEFFNWKHYGNSTFYDSKGNIINNKKNIRK